SLPHGSAARSRSILRGRDRCVTSRTGMAQRSSTRHPAHGRHRDDGRVPAEGPTGGGGQPGRTSSQAWPVAASAIRVSDRRRVPLAGGASGVRDSGYCAGSADHLAGAARGAAVNSLHGATLAFLLAWGTAVGVDLVSWPQAMISRPLIAGAVTAALLGDLGGGLRVALVMELFALDVLPCAAPRPIPTTAPRPWLRLHWPRVSRGRRHWGPRCWWGCSPRCWAAGACNGSGKTK